MIGFQETIDFDKERQSLYSIYFKYLSFISFVCLLMNSHKLFLTLHIESFRNFHPPYGISIHTGEPIFVLDFYSPLFCKSCPNRFVIKSDVSINLSTQLLKQLSVLLSSLLPGDSTHLSQQISLNSWI